MSPDVGMVEFGYMPIDVKCKTCGYDGELFLCMDLASPGAFRGHPALRHRRAREYWGPYPEGLNPGDTELAYARQVGERGGTGIIWPFTFGQWGAFGHIGTQQSY